MKRIFILFALVLSSIMAMANTYTFYFQNSGSWSLNGGVKIWAWAGSNTINGLGDFGDRPTMTQDPLSGLWYITFTLDGDCTGVKFDDGNNNSYKQVDSADDIHDNGLYNASGYVRQVTNWTVYFEKPSGWSGGVDIYTWTHANSTDRYPGVACGYDASKHLYYYTIIDATGYDDGAPYIIFDNQTSSTSDGTDRTGDISYEDVYDGAVFRMTDVTDAYYEVVGSYADYTTTADTSDDWIVYFDNSETNWDTVYCYWWSSDSKYPNNGVYPGQAMSYDVETGLYYIVLPANAASLDGFGMLFDDGLSGNGNQTSDQTASSDEVKNGAVYTIDGLQADSESEYTRTYTIYFKVIGDTGWDNYYAYIYQNVDGSTVDIVGEFPGSITSSTTVNDENSLANGYYEFTFEYAGYLSSSDTRVMFSDGTNNNKTTTYDFTDEGIYNTKEGYIGTTSGSGADEKFVLYFDPSGVTGTIQSVTVHAWFPNGNGDIFAYPDMTYDNGLGYWVYSFVYPDKQLTDEGARVEFVVYTSSEDETGTKYPQDGTTDLEKWELVNYGVYGVDGFITTNYDESDYTTYTVYYKQSETTTDTDYSWESVGIWVFNKDIPSMHYDVSATLWPGDEMTSLGDKQWKYTFRAPSGATLGLDFDEFDENYQGTRPQTTDIKFIDNGLYEYDDSGTTMQSDPTGGPAYVVGAELCVTTVGYATVYSDNPYVMPITTDVASGTVTVADTTYYNKPLHATSGYYFKDNVHGTAITSSSKAAEGDEEEDAFAGTDWFPEGSIVPAKTALLIHSQKTDSNPDDAEAGDTNITSGKRYYLARKPSDTELADTVSSKVEGNLLHGSSTRTLTNVDGDYSSAYKFYKLANDPDDGLAFYYGNTDGAAFISDANKAWLAIPEAQAANLTKIVFAEEPDEHTTGINTISAAAAVKSGDAIYNLQGMRVNDMSQKGIYIVGGKKVIKQ